MLQHVQHALFAYTLEHGDPRFLHQHAVDALGAQHAGPHTTPIQLTFALVGLYLHVERGYSGRQVQRVHATLAHRKPSWPIFVLPADRGAITADDVMAAASGAARDAMIDAWCAAVWAAYGSCRPAVIALLRHDDIV